MPNTGQIKDHFAPSSVRCLPLATSHLTPPNATKAARPNISRTSFRLAACPRMNAVWSTLGSLVPRQGEGSQTISLLEAPLCNTASISRMFPLSAGHHSTCNSYSCHSSRISIQDVYLTSRLQFHGEASQIFDECNGDSEWFRWCGSRFDSQALRERVSHAAITLRLTHSRYHASDTPLSAFQAFSSFASCAASLSRPDHITGYTDQIDLLFDLCANVVIERLCDQWALLSASVTNYN